MSTKGGMGAGGGWRMRGEIYSLNVTEQIGHTQASGTNNSVCISTISTIKPH